MRFEEIRSQILNRHSGPFVFLHIPKTAGISVIHALRDLKPWAHTLTHAPFLSPQLLAEAAALPPAALPETLIYGHPLEDTFPAMQNATLLTVIREPAAHAVSHYLFTRRRPEIPLHHEAMTLGFADFIRRNWQYLVYQSISLGVSNSLLRHANQKQFLERAPRIHEILRRIDIVGTTDALPSFINRVARALAVPPPKIGHLNQAVEEGISRDQIAELRAIYQYLAQDPKLAGLIACEQALYDTVKLRGSRRKLTPRPGGRSQR